jgi:hypothetical protein
VGDGDAETTYDRKSGGMRRLGMVEALTVQEQDPSGRDLSFLERLGLLVD